MQTKNRLFDDLARVANGAASIIIGAKGEVDASVRHRLEDFLSTFDLIPRDEFEALKAVAVKARMEQELLENRVVELEKKLNKLVPSASSKERRTVKKGTVKK
jgi:BMFP domain-containing protein YqiC